MSHVGLDMIAVGWGLQLQRQRAEVGGRPQFTKAPIVRHVTATEIRLRRTVVIALPEGKNTYHFLLRHTPI